MVVKRLSLQQSNMPKGNNKNLKRTKRQSSRSNKLFIKAINTEQQHYKITWKDFIPPIFFKLYQLLRGYVNKKYIQVTYVELGITIVFVGTILALAISYFVVPIRVADAMQAFYLYTHKDFQPQVTSITFSKANYGKALLHNYMNGVVLGVQEDKSNYKNNKGNYIDSNSIDYHQYDDSNVKGNQKRLLNQNLKMEQNISNFQQLSTNEMHGDDYHSYWWF